MAFTRNSGLALGFGIGIIIAGVFFGLSWLTKNSGDLLKTQALQETVASVAPTLPPTQVTINTPAPTPVGSSNDNIVNRLAPPQDDVINGIQQNLQQLYGAQ